MDSREIQDRSRLDYQRKQKGKIEPPPLLRIGEYHPQTGRYEVLFPNGGKAIAGNKLFNSSTPYGTPVRATQAFGSQSIALDYRNHQPIQVAQEEEAIPQLTGFMVWNTGYTKNGYADKAVDFFSGITDRNQQEWKNSVSYDDLLLPDIAGLKLLYIPMITRDLNNEEIQRLRDFRDAGGIIFVTGEHASFNLERQKANQIMSILGSPLRCVDTGATYIADSASINNLLYPAQWTDEVRVIFGQASCEITGGTSISRIPQSIYSRRSNITWLAYDQGSRTILSGDVDWAGQITPTDRGDNAKFAQSLLNLQW